MEPYVAGTALVALGGLWIAATLRHGRRRARHADWSSSGRPELWTSAAACPECGRTGGVLTEDGQDATSPLRYSCLACGHEHRRRNPG